MSGFFFSSFLISLLCLNLRCLERLCFLPALLSHLLLQNLSGHLSADISNPSLQVPDACFPGVIVDNLFQSCSRDGQILLRQAVALHLLGNEIILSNVEFFILCVAADLYHFHTVQQRPWNRLGGVGSGDEKSLRQIHRNLHIVIPEFHVLLAVQNLQQSRGGVSLVVAADLVNLV